MNHQLADQQSVRPVLLMNDRISEICLFFRKVLDLFIRVAKHFFKKKVSSN